MKLWTGVWGLWKDISKINVDKLKVINSEYTSEKKNDKVGELVLPDQVLFQTMRQAPETEWFG